jgi:hypothetical protein
MPPSLQVNVAGITVWEDKAQQLVRSQLQFDDPTAIQVNGATSGDRIRITGVADPTSDADVSSKGYVDGSVQGLSLKKPVRLATRAPVALSALQSGVTIDGVIAAAGDRVLLMGQTNGGENGIWIVGATGFPTRPVDFGGASVPYAACGAYAFVDQGLTLARRGFVCIAPVGADVVGEATDLPFVQVAVRPEDLVDFGLQTPDGLRVGVDKTVIPWLAAPSNAFSGELVAPRLNGLDTARIQAGSDAVNLDYLRTVNQQNAYKAPVHAATTENVADLTAALAVGAALDGVVLTANMRVLVKDQTDGTQNGIYVVVAGGAPERSSDLAAGYGAAGCNVPVMGGTNNAVTTWVCTNANGADVVGTSALVFAPLINPRDIPWLRRDNTFTAQNTFGGLVRVSNATEATSQTIGALRVDGGVAVGGNVFCTQVFNMSDARLKADLVPLADAALNAVDAMRGYEFAWNDHPDNAAAGRSGRTVGLIAQEVNAAGAPLAVHRDADSDLLAVDYTKLVPYLVESVRALKRRCEELEERLPPSKCARPSEE